MGFWSDRVLPHMIDRGMRNDFMASHRDRAAPMATGEVLEIGFGSGLNLPFYTDTVTRIYGLEPSDLLREKSEELITETGLPVELVDASAEAIPLADRSVDSVVSSWTLCSIPDVERSLEEIRRVLKPGGQFIFIEHGRSPDIGLARWQDRLAPLTRRMLGCDLSRPMDQLIKNAGFDVTTMEKDYVEGPKILSYHYIGRATNH